MTERIRVPKTQSKKEYLTLPPEERELYVREILRQTVGMNQYGVTVGSIKRSLPFDSRTVEKHLSILVHTNEIYGVKVGPTTLYLPNSSVMFSFPEKNLLLGEKEYGANLIQNRKGEFVYIQEKEKRQDSHEVSGGIMIPLSTFAQFVDYLSRILNHIKEADGEHDENFETRRTQRIALKT
jgi:hypothetical protein